MFSKLIWRHFPTLRKFSWVFWKFLEATRIKIFLKQGNCFLIYLALFRSLTFMTSVPAELWEIFRSKCPSRKLFFDPSFFTVCHRIMLFALFHFNPFELFPFPPGKVTETSVKSLETLFGKFFTRTICLIVRFAVHSSLA